MKQTLITLSIAIAASLGWMVVEKKAAAQLIGVTRPCYQPGIPARNYDFGFRSASITKLSEAALPLTSVTLGETLPPNPGSTPGMPTTPPATVSGNGGSSFNYQVVPGTRRQPALIRNQSRIFQFVGPKSLVDHCSISDMAVWVDEAGRWSVNLQATQNDPDRDRQRFTDHLMRNQFHIKLRFYAAFNANSSAVSNELARPQLAEIELCPFWVERSRPQKILRQGYHPAVAQFFESIDRVEIEFYYK